MPQYLVLRADRHAVGTGREVVVGELHVEISRVLQAEPVGSHGERLARAILKARAGDVQVDPGYDGVYGKVRVLPDLGANVPGGST